MHCKECGNSMEKHEKFCSQCGTPREGLDIDWNLSNYPEPSETLSLDFNWATGEFEERKIEEISEEATEELEESADGLDKFFDYKKANDDFQQLLEVQQGRVSELASQQTPENSDDTDDYEEDAYEEIEKIYMEELEEAIDQEEPEVIWIQELKSEEPEGDLTEDLVEEELEEESEEKPLWFLESEETEQEEPIEKKSKLGKIYMFLIAVLILLALLIGSIIGVQFFMPDSRAAELAGQAQNQILGSFFEMKDKVVSKFGETDSEDKEIEGEEDIDDPEGLEDTEGDKVEEPEELEVDPALELISSVIHVNKNILTIKPNEKLYFEEEKDYGRQGINESKATEENHETIVKTLIDFNSKWVDYVNNKEKDVIDLTKKGSQARRNVETFSKVGKVKQTFLVFELGEIRKFEDEYYVWIYEEIQEEKDGKIQVNKYDYVYSLEEIDGKMLITNYYKY